MQKKGVLSLASKAVRQNNTRSSAYIKEHNLDQGKVTEVMKKAGEVQRGSFLRLTGLLRFSYEIGKYVCES